MVHKLGLRPIFSLFLSPLFITGLAVAGNNDIRIGDNSVDLTPYQGVVKAQHQAVVNSIDQSVLDSTQARLPQFVAQIKNGVRIFVSQQGKEIVSLIDTLPARTGTERSAAFSRLQQFAQEKYPEALNFYGYCFEHGAFGAQKNPENALAYYRAAAASGYPTALYNAALAYAYGRGTRQDLKQAYALAATAATAVNEESSFRACGLAAYLAYRQNDLEGMRHFSKSCASPLAGFAKVRVEPNTPLPQKITLLRQTFATGATGALSEIVELAKTSKDKEGVVLACKYELVRTHYNAGPINAATMKAEARHCLANTTVSDSEIVGVAGFVPNEIDALRRMTLANQSYYSVGIPFLPFRPTDAERFLGKAN